MKKQIVFVEPGPTASVFKIARTLKLTKRYETVLITFKKINKNSYKKAYDKIFVYELNDIPSLKNLLCFFKEVLSKKGREFIKEIRKLNPYVVQITGLNMFTILNFYLFKNKKRIYYAYDIWEPYKKKFSLKRGSGIMIYFNTFNEKFCFRKADGILHKGPQEELNLLSYKINVPSLAFLPGCLDEWNITPKKKQLKKDDVHIVYAGGSWITWEGHVSFLDIIRKITSQKIHFHIFDLFLTKEKEKIYKKIEKENKYFRLYRRMKLGILSKKLSKYDFALIPDFIYDSSIVNPLFSKITMAGKLFTYIEAGLPIIISEQLGFMKKIVEENGIGFSIKYEDLKKLRKMIEKQDYKQLKRNVEKAQKKFSLSRDILNIEKFYEKVYNFKNN